MTIFRGYERRTIATADLQPGDCMYVPGAGLLGSIARITKDGADTVLWFLGEAHGRRRWFTVRRKSTGRSTIHVKQDLTGGAV